MELGFGNYSCNWGLHMCGLYDRESERDDIIMGFLQRGNQDGDLQLYCPTERSSEDFHRTWELRFPEYAGQTHDPERFRILDAHSLYYPDGTFSPWTMEQNLQSFFEDSQKDGRRPIRATAEMLWALDAIPGVEHLMAYESRLNYFIPGKPWASICLYNVNRFPGSTIMGVLRTHPYTLTGGVITENPYYQNPDDFLAMHAPHFLTR